MAKNSDYTFDNCEVECDNCRCNVTIDYTDYSSVNKELRESGWVIKNIQGQWMDFCSEECYKSYTGEGMIDDYTNRLEG